MAEEVRIDGDPPMKILDDINSTTGENKTLLNSLVKKYDQFVSYCENTFSQEELVGRGFDDREPVFFVLMCTDVMLRGISQVFLCNDPITGFFICIGLALSSVKLMCYGILGSTLGTFAAATIARPPAGDLLAGLCGYDGALVGCACYAFLDPSCAIGSAVLLSLLSGILHVAVENILKAWELPCFTFSFNICLIMFLYAASQNIITLKLSSAAPVVHDANFEEMSINFVVDAAFRGVGQFMFVDTTVGGAFVVAGIAWSSRKGAGVALLGSMVGWITAFYILKVKSIVSIRTGLLGYNSAGACTALAGGIFYKTSDSAVTLGIIGAMLAALFDVGIAGMFGGLPVLTFPFITSTWMIMLSRTKWHQENDGYFGNIWVQSSENRQFRVPFIDYNPFWTDEEVMREDEAGDGLLESNHGSMSTSSRREQNDVDVESLERRPDLAMPPSLPPLLPPTYAVRKLVVQRGILDRSTSNASSGNDVDSSVSGRRRRQLDVSVHARPKPHGNLDSSMSGSQAGRRGEVRRVPKLLSSLDDSINGNTNKSVSGSRVHSQTPKSSQSDGTVTGLNTGPDTSGVPSPTIPAGNNRSLLDAPEDDSVQTNELPAGTHSAKGNYQKEV